MKFSELTPAQVKLLGQQMRLSLEGQIRHELKQRAEEVLALLDDDELVMLLETDLRQIPNPRSHHADVSDGATPAAPGRGRRCPDPGGSDSTAGAGPVDAEED